MADSKSSSSTHRKVYICNSRSSSVERSKQKIPERRRGSFDSPEDKRKELLAQRAELRRRREARNRVDIHRRRVFIKK